MAMRALRLKTEFAKDYIPVLHRAGIFSGDEIDLVQQLHSLLKIEIRKAKVMAATFVKITREIIPFAGEKCNNRERIQSAHAKCASASRCMKKYLQRIEHLNHRETRDLEDCKTRLHALRVELEYALKDLLFLVGESYCQVCVSWSNTFGLEAERIRALEAKVQQLEAQAQEAKAQAQKAKAQARELFKETLGAKDQLIQVLSSGKYMHIDASRDQTGLGRATQPKAKHLWQVQANKDQVEENCYGS